MHGFPGMILAVLACFLSIPAQAKCKTKKLLIFNLFPNPVFCQNKINQYLKFFRKFLAHPFLQKAFPRSWKLLGITKDSFFQLTGLSSLYKTWYNKSLYLPHNTSKE